ncbi:hypothetical protein GCM10009844_16590 [Nocardioides koreensis]|uniref:Uncharacterized protein n=1 Tax=Nocardioides koreensis TaxID=433651 RepID=A0ABN2ZKW7_9ACTN
MSHVYEPARARQLRILLRVVVGVAGLMTVFAVFFLLGGSDPGLVLMVVLLPAVLMLALAARTLKLLERSDPRARSWVVGTAWVVVLIGLLLSRTAPGIVVAAIGILLLLIAVLPGRDPGPTSDG